MSDRTYVVTGPDTVFSYLNVLEPRAAAAGAEAKYSASLIIPKSDKVTIKKIKEAIRIAYEEGEAKLRGNGNTVPPLDKIHNPLRDGDEDKPDDPAYRNAYFVNASNKNQPKLYDRHLNEILDPRELYSGIIGRAGITFFAYNAGGSKGITCGLEGIKKLRDGTPLGGRSNVRDSFEGLDDEEAGDEDFLG